MKPQRYIFVSMPFAPEFDDVYRLGIKPACEGSGARVERLDEQVTTGHMLDHLYDQIHNADLIIADTTNINPNVYYEIGYAHALGKPVILLTKNMDDTPFNLQSFQHIIYGGRISELIPKLTEKIKRVLALLEMGDSKAPERSVKELTDVLLDSAVTKEIPFSALDREHKKPLDLKELRSNSAKMLTIYLRSKGDKAMDILAIRRIHGILISHPGNDRFAFYVFEGRSGYLLDFPQDTTDLSEDALSRIEEMVGKNNYRVEGFVLKNPKN